MWTQLLFVIKVTIEKDFANGSNITPGFFNKLFFKRGAKFRSGLELIQDGGILDKHRLFISAPARMRNSQFFHFIIENPG